MAINKKLIHFQKKADFDTQLAARNILDTSIVFIKDAKQIYTHGQLYNCPFTEDEIRSLLNNKADLSKLNDYLTKTDAAAIYQPKGNYITSIPTANGTTAGIVKQGGDVTISNGVITVNDDSHNHIISNVDGLQSALDAKQGIISDLSTIRSNASKSVAALQSIENSLKQCLQNNPQSFTSEQKKQMLENLGIFILDSFISENITENSQYGISYELGITEEDYNRVNECTQLIVNAKGLITVFTERTSISDDYAPQFKALSIANIDSTIKILQYELTAYQKSNNDYYVMYSCYLDNYASTYDLDKKQDIIPDLDYIRSCAFNALQSVPAATTSTAGIVKVGSNISVSSGTISLSKANVTAALGYTPPTAYTNMTASEATTGTATTGRVISAKVLHDKINEMLPTTLSEANSYTDTKVSELVGQAPEALNTIYELAEAMATNQGAVDTLESAIGNKVDKVSGKGLSTNDYTTTEKNKLAGIASGAEVNVQSDWSVTDTTSDAYIKNKPSLSAVATSGSYSDLSGRPTVDSTISTSSTNAVQNKAITAAVNAKYTKPSTGIPSSDLSSDVQGSLAKADSALQSFTETDPVFTASAAASIKSSDISNWNSKTSNVGTITGIKMNGTSKGTSGVVDLGTVITAHQDISGKVDKVSGKGLSTNDYTDAEKSKLAGIAEGANKYSLPLAASGTRGGIQLGYSASGANIPVAVRSEKAYVALTKTAVTSALGYTPPTTNTTYSEATTSTAGLMSATDKTKVNKAVISSSSTITDIVTLTKSAYDALTSKSSTTLYIVNN